jgi:N-methylhydantoinase A
LKRVGIDIGGTFTDFFYYDDESGQLATLKVPSTPSDSSVAGTEGLKTLCDRVGISPSDIDFLFHGTTVATNIILEHNGASVGLITTAGFRDVLHIGRKNRPLNFSNYQDIPRQIRPISMRRHRKVVTERVDSSGNVLVPLDKEEVRRAVCELRDEGVEAIAVCCLFSFVNSNHEKEIGEIIAREYPEAHVSLSHEIVPLYREYERFSTTALNAFVGPKTTSYLEQFSRRLAQAGLRREMHLMSSAGGSIGAQQAKKSPVSLLLSGPVGALIAGIEIGRKVNHSSVITLDVGGTSADIGVAPEGGMRMKHLLDTQIGEYDAMVPMVDIDTIGAGGGSIAYVDNGGMFRVGPRSAGARPGPACYGHGGTEPTVTDAITCLGWFRPEALEASGLDLQPEVADRVIQEKIASPLGMGLQASAMGIYQVITTSMVEAIRVNSVSKGYDPRDFALLAYGGAGAAFSVEVGRQLQVAKVVIPRHPGVGAASGLLNCDMKYEHMSTVWMDLENPDPSLLQESYQNLAQQVGEKLAADGFANDETRLVYKADCRYRGQGYELTVEVPTENFDEDWIGSVNEAFHQAHETAYMRRFKDTPVHMINIRVSGYGLVSRLDTPAIEPGSESAQQALTCERQAWFQRGDELVSYQTPFYQREQLLCGNRIEGPAIIEQSDTTTVLIPGSTALVDALGNLIVTFDEAGR